MTPYPFYPPQMPMPTPMHMPTQTYGAPQFMQPYQPPQGPVHEDFEDDDWVSEDDKPKKKKRKILQSDDEVDELPSTPKKFSSPKKSRRPGRPQRGPSRVSSDVEVQQTLKSSPPPGASPTEKPSSSDSLPDPHKPPQSAQRPAKSPRPTRPQRRVQQDYTSSPVSGPDEPDVAPLQGVADYLKADKAFVFTEQPTLDPGTGKILSAEGFVCPMGCKIHRKSTSRSDYGFVFSGSLVKHFDNSHFQTNETHREFLNLCTENVVISLGWPMDNLNHFRAAVKLFREKGIDAVVEDAR